MPVEIGQLIINARVVSDNDDNTTPSPDIVEGQNKQQVIIQACVIEVLRILEDKQER
ncbi:hypothetical protein MNBD_GAMMA22-3085 [hydrothermal vent metagenome]|uniref:Uncharacterized protein n=1 Tax=hydrothermal vent metagenome TaxID=652676 RepID=A0A3B1AMI2_9ZZZZ